MDVSKELELETPSSARSNFKTEKQSERLSSLAISEELRYEVMVRSAHKPNVASDTDSQKSTEHGTVIKHIGKG